MNQVALWAVCRATDAASNMTLGVMTDLYRSLEVLKIFWLREAINMYGNDTTSAVDRIINDDVQCY